jgi:formylglycine-generating enzyme required for sulfatase activity
VAVDGAFAHRKAQIPLVASRWKFELAGFDTVERASFPDGSITVTMDQKGEAPTGMVRVDLAASSSATTPIRALWPAGFETLLPVPLSNFWIDKFEVTNAEFKRFIDQGDYEKLEYGKHEFRKDGRSLSWPVAMKFFHDRTGRPGLAFWIQGDYSAGQQDYPVTGVSWFEAAAYAEFAGKSLPTMYHWIAAASLPDGSSVIPLSNFAGAGPAPKAPTAA